MITPTEIRFVANYLVNSLLTPEQQSTVCTAFIAKLTTRFIPRHWFPLEPERGSGFRAISFDPSRHDGYLDPVLRILAELLGSSNRDLRRNIIQTFGSAHSSGWTIWCDPGCVSIRVNASGGEIRQLWGRLPAHLTYPRFVQSTPPIPSAASNQSPADSPSPSKSRAIPILAPAGIARFAVIPPTPVSNERPGALAMESTLVEEIESHDYDVLDDTMNGSFKSAYYYPRPEDPFLRPSSRTSCASSSSDGSDNSGFSSSSSSTATSVAPLGVHMKKTGHQHYPVPPSSLGYIRHYSSNSLPFVSMNNFSSAGFGSLAPVQNPGGRRASSPAQSAPKRKHTASASVSSLNGGRGLIVLKEGPGTVTEHSGGKVGVMGGGVLLGLPKDKDSGAVVNSANRRMANRRTRPGTVNA